MKKFWICLLALALLLAPAGALAAIRTVQPGEDFYYLDEANVLSRETEGEIFFCNKLLEEACGAQIVIVALKDIGGADILDYTAELGDSWGIGGREENNGFLLLMTIDDENYYAMPNQGLRGIFPASVIKEMYDEDLEADFAAGRYDAGARKFFEAVFERTVDYYNLSLTPADGVAAYESYVAREGSAGSFGGARSGGARADWGAGYYGDYGYEDYYEDDGVSILGIIVSLVVMLLLLRLLARVMRFGGGGFWGRHPFLSGFLFGSMTRRNFHPYDRPGPFGPGPSGPPPGGPRRRPPSGRFGGFGGGAGRGGFGGGFGGGGFGGARGGGGSGFGGGAGRGRH